MNEENPLVAAMRRPKLDASFSVDLPDAQVGDEVKFIVKAVQDGKAILEAQKIVAAPDVTMTQESHSPS